MSERETALKEQKRPPQNAVDILEKVAWDAGVEGALVWERDQRERLQVERDGYRGALVGLLPLLGGHPEILRKRINQALAAGADPVPVCQWREIATAPDVAWGQEPVNVLLWGKQLGVRTGRACKHPDGSVFAGVANVNGNIAEDLATHWQPLPAPPVALVPAEGEKP